MKADLISNLVLLIVGITLLFVLSDYPDMARRFPQITIIALIIFLSLDVLKKIRAIIREKPLTICACAMLIPDGKIGPGQGKTLHLFADKGPERFIALTGMFEEARGHAVHSRKAGTGKQVVPVQEMAYTSRNDQFAAGRLFLGDQRIDVQEHGQGVRAYPG